MKNQRKLMFNKTVASIVSAFTKTIKELDDVIVQNEKAQDANTVIINKLVASNGAHQQEIDDAAAISTKLKAIFN
jgi:hypothetical protein